MSPRKNSASELMNSPIPSRWRSMEGRCSAMLVLRVALLGMLEVPEGAPAADGRQRREVVRRRRGGGGPLQRPGIPGVRAGRRPGAQAPREIPEEDQHGDAEEARADSRGQVQLG